MVSEDVIVKNKTGIHARPAAEFVQTAGRYSSNITIRKDAKSVNAKSLLNILALGISQNSRVTISAEGEDAAEAVKALVRLIEAGFGEI